VYVTASQAPTDHSAACVFTAVPVAHVMGKLEAPAIALSPEPLGPQSVELTSAVPEAYSKRYQPGMQVLAFAFQLAPGKGLAELKRYVDARASALAKHGGAVLACGCTPRTATWPYDTFELIAFSKEGGLQGIMADEEYKQNPEVRASQQIFSGQGAIAALSVSKG